MAVREWASLRYINPAVYFKKIRINVIFYRFSLINKSTKKKKNLNIIRKNPICWPRPKGGVTEM